MKKFLALVLALIMTFSLVTTAFAIEETTAAPEETTASSEDTEEAGALDWLLDLPVWTLGPASTITKIALKLVKVALVLGIVDTDEIIQEIVEMIAENSKGAETAVAV